MEIHKKHKDQENIPKPFLGKSIAQNVRRPAFNEVGNRIPAPKTQQACLQKKIATKTQENTLDKIENVKSRQVKVALLPNPNKQHAPKKEANVVNQPIPEIGNVTNKEKKIIKQESTTAVMKIAPTNKAMPSYSSKELYGILDIDDIQDDPMLVPEYINDIITHLFFLEEKYCINKNYLTNHSSTPRMRTVLINWICEVLMNFKFLTETFHLSVAIVDRYLQLNKKIGRESLQLVGTAATLIAVKYEEMVFPELADFQYICDDAFSGLEILAMEKDILRQLEFSLGRPLSIHFLRRFNRIAKVDSFHHILGKYLLELALQDYRLCHVKPSLQAAAACCLAISILNNISNPAKVWTPRLSHFTTYSYAQIKNTMAEFCVTLLSAEKSQYKAIRNKYALSASAKISVNPKLKGPLVQTLASQVVVLKK